MTLRTIKHYLAVSIISALSINGVRAESAPRGFEGLQGVPIPQVQIHAANGQAQYIGDFLGKVVILNLWATWCVPCIKEMPSLDRLAARLDKRKAVVLAVSQDKGGMAVAKPFTDRLHLTNLAVFADPGGKLSRDLAVRGLPTTFIITPDGNITARIEGPTEWDAPEVTNFIATIDR